MPAPKTAQSSEEDSNAISVSLAARRRRSLASILRDFRQSRHDDKRPRGVSEESAIEEQEGDGDLPANEDEEGDVEERIDTIDFEAFQRAMGKPVTMVKNWRSEGGGEDVCLDETGTSIQQEYVWDLLFENQRGIYILGAAHFSSKTLLPADPTPFSRPDRPIPSASSLSSNISAQNQQHAPINAPDSDSNSNSKIKTQSNNPAQSMRTSYTLETYQPPNPQWEYLTPWMVNMRSGTDEVGWRYNAWFKKGGWKSHAGNLGWAGWVRRREWVRLRRVKPLEPEMRVGASNMPETKLEQTSRQDKWEGESKNKSMGSHTPLNDVLAGDVDDNVANLLEEMGTLLVDRERLDLWKAWLSDISKDDPTWRKLEAIVSDEKAVSLSACKQSW